MRLFIGLVLPKEIKDELFTVQKKIPNKLAKINWMAKKRLHLTMKFLGNIDRDKLKEIEDRLGNIKFKPFKVNLTKIGFFPNVENIRILWAGLSPERDIIKLQQKIDGELLSLFKSDQTFNPHLTLGRIKLIKKKKEFLDCLNKIKIESKIFTIKNFSLIESKLIGGIHCYNVLSEFNT